VINCGVHELFHRGRVLTHQTSETIPAESLRGETTPVSNGSLRGGYDPYFFDQVVWMMPAMWD
jgi:hypothetical protein